MNELTVQLQFHRGCLMEGEPTALLGFLNHPQGSAGLTGPKVGHYWAIGFISAHSNRQRTQADPFIVVLNNLREGVAVLVHPAGPQLAETNPMPKAAALGA